MGDSPPTVQFLVTCLLDTLFPKVAQSTIDVLEKQGVTVNVKAGQTCCGQPAFNGGYWNEARQMARHMLDVFADGDEPVLISSGSCGAMIEHYYPLLFQNDPEYGPVAKRLAGRMVEFSQYLVDVLGVEDVGAAYDAKVVLHPSCHGLRELHIKEQPRRLLEHVKGLTLLEQERPETCCGFGGVFSIKMSAISEAMMNDRIHVFEAVEPDLIVGGDVSCLMHLEGGLRKQGSRIRTMHIAQLLAEGMKA
jgi:L-lactate dehydrogenase complex protein LldE